MGLAHVSSYVCKTLGELGPSPCILAGDKKFHEEMARRSAWKVSSAGGRAEKARARSQCVAHLIASLQSHPEPTGGGDDPS